MRVDVNQVIKDYDGTLVANGYEPITKEEIEAGKKPVPLPFTLRDALIVALKTPHADETPDAKEKLFRHLLAKRIFESDGIVELTNEEATKTDKLVDKRWKEPMIYGVVHEMLENPIAAVTEIKDKKKKAAK